MYSVVALDACRYQDMWLAVDHNAFTFQNKRHKMMQTCCCNVNDYLHYVHFRVFASVIVTAKNVTYALASTPSTSKAFESGRKLSVLLKCEDSKLTTKMITPVSIGYQII